MKEHYGQRQPVRLHKACWITYDDPKAFKEFELKRRKDLANDVEDKLVFLAESAWSLKMAQENHPDIQFHFTSDI